MDYLAIRALHESAVALSVTGFAARAGAGFAGASWVRKRWARTLPHIIDTSLLASATTLLVMLHANPFTTPWLAAKLCGLVAYIGLGVVALRPGFAPGTRAAATLSALGVVAWIVSVAFTKSPLGLFATL